MLDKMPNGDRNWGSWPHRALQDYAAARCCIFNSFLPAGLMLAQQSVEKLLKAYLRARHPGESEWVGPTKRKPGLHPRALAPVNANHDLLAHAQLVDRDYGFTLEADHANLLKHLSWAFSGKYPGGYSEIKTMSGLDVFAVDRLVIPLFLNLPLDESLKWRVGIHNVVGDTRPNSADVHWLSHGNDVLAAVIPQLQRDVEAGLARLRVGL